MVILVAGASHTGKTLLAQRMLEEYRCPYLSIDHLKIEITIWGQSNLRLLRTNTTTPQSPRPSF